MKVPIIILLLIGWCNLFAQDSLLFKKQGNHDSILVSTIINLKCENYVGKRVGELLNVVNLSLNKKIKMGDKISRLTGVYLYYDYQVQLTIFIDTENIQKINRGRLRISMRKLKKEYISDVIVKYKKKVICKTY